MIFPPFEVATKIAITLGIGLLVGLERQWSQKDVGVRTFSITALSRLFSILILYIWPRSVSRACC
jgi:uncharacterized membrane protein YhiD involved in acid resistance